MGRQLICLVPHQLGTRATIRHVQRPRKPQRRATHQTMPHDKINIRVVVVATGLFLFFAFLVSLGVWVCLPTVSLADFLTMIVATFTFQCLIGFLGHLILRSRERGWRRRTSSQWQGDSTAFMAMQDERMASITVQCPTCEQRAVPIVNSDDRFHCDDCEQDFQDQHHGIIDIVEYEKRTQDTSEGPYPLSP